VKSVIGGDKEKVPHKKAQERGEKYRAGRQEDGQDGDQDQKNKGYEIISQ
jgi:hypothetical protein